MTRLALALATLAACAPRGLPRPMPDPPSPDAARSFEAAPTEPTAHPTKRDELDQFVAMIVAAAEARDLDTLAQLVSDDFTSDLMGPDGVEAALETWSRDPQLYLEKLVRLLRGPCAFWQTRDHWICPRAVVEADLAEFGDAERIHLVLRDGQWHWVAFIAEEDVTTSAVSSQEPPSLAPVVK